MNVAEVLLRLGCALVAWMIVFTHLVWLATLRATGCEADGDQLWRLLLGFAAFTVFFSLLLNASRPMKEVHAILRWGAVGVLLLLPLAVPPVWHALQTATLSGSAICPSDPTPAWHFWWAPVQICALTALALGTWRAYKSHPRSEATP